MIKEIPYISIDGAPGVDQDTYPDLLMRVGGCAATVACESLLFFEMKGLLPPLRPFAEQKLTRETYLSFLMEMKPHLHPRLTGVDTVGKYLEGFTSYLKAHGITEADAAWSALFPLRTIPGETDLAEAKRSLMEQLDRDIPVPDLTLLHEDRAFEDYGWHWFMLTGYADGEDAARKIRYNPSDEPGVAREEDALQNGHLFVRAATYGEFCWLDFDRLWQTGQARRGALLLYSGGSRQSRKAEGDER